MDLNEHFKMIIYVFNIVKTDCIFLFFICLFCCLAESDILF